MKMIQTPAEQIEERDFAILASMAEETEETEERDFIASFLSPATDYSEYEDQ